MEHTTIHIIQHYSTPQTAMILKFSMSPMTPANFLMQICQIFFNLDSDILFSFSKVEFFLGGIKKKPDFLVLLPRTCTCIIYQSPFDHNLFIHL